LAANIYITMRKLSGKRIIKVISFLLAILMVWQGVVWADPDIFRANNLQVHTLRKESDFFAVAAGYLSAFLIDLETRDDIHKNIFPMEEEVRRELARLLESDDIPKTYKRNPPTIERGPFGIGEFVIDAGVYKIRYYAPGIIQKRYFDADPSDPGASYDVREDRWVGKGRYLRRQVFIKRSPESETVPSVGKILEEALRKRFIYERVGYLRGLCPGLSQRKLADEARVETNTISEIEKGHTKHPTKDILRQIAFVLAYKLHVDMDDLLEKVFLVSPRPTVAGTPEERLAEVKELPSLGERIEYLREARGWLWQRELARETGLLVKNIHLIEIGKINNLSPKTSSRLAEALAPALDISPEELISEVFLLSTGQIAKGNAGTLYRELLAQAEKGKAGSMRFYKRWRLRKAARNLKKRIESSEIGSREKERMAKAIDTFLRADILEFKPIVLSDEGVDVDDQLRQCGWWLLGFNTIESEAIQSGEPVSALNALLKEKFPNTVGLSTRMLDLIGFNRFNYDEPLLQEYLLHEIICPVFGHARSRKIQEKIFFEDNYKGILGVTKDGHKDGELTLILERVIKEELGNFPKEVEKVSFEEELDEFKKLGFRNDGPRRAAQIYRAWMLRQSRICRLERGEDGKCPEEVDRLSRYMNAKMNWLLQMETAWSMAKDFLAARSKSKGTRKGRRDILETLWEDEERSPTKRLRGRQTLKNAVQVLRVAYIHIMQNLAGTLDAEVFDLIKEDPYIAKGKNLLERITGKDIEIEETEGTKEATATAGFSDEATTPEAEAKDIWVGMSFREKLKFVIGHVNWRSVGKTFALAFLLCGAFHLAVPLLIPQAYIWIFDLVAFGVPFGLFIYIIMKHFSWKGVFIAVGLSILLSMLLPIRWLGLSLAIVIMHRMWKQKGKEAYESPAGLWGSEKVLAEKEKDEDEADAEETHTEKDSKAQEKVKKKKISRGFQGRHPDIYITDDILTLIDRITKLRFPRPQEGGEDKYKRAAKLDTRTVLDNLFRLEISSDTIPGPALMKELRPRVEEQMERLESGFDPETFESTDHDVQEALRFLDEWDGKKAEEETAEALHEVSREVSKRLLQSSVWEEENKKEKQAVLDLIVERVLENALDNLMGMEEEEEWETEEKKKQKKEARETERKKVKSIWEEKMAIIKLRIRLITAREEVESKEKDPLKSPSAGDYYFLGRNEFFFEDPWKPKASSRERASESTFKNALLKTPNAAPLKKDYYLTFGVVKHVYEKWNEAKTAYESCLREFGFDPEELDSLEVALARFPWWDGRLGEGLRLFYELSAFQMTLNRSPKVVKNLGKLGEFKKAGKKEDLLKIALTVLLLGKSKQKIPIGGEEESENDGAPSPQRGIGALAREDGPIPDHRLVNALVKVLFEKGLFETQEEDVYLFGDDTSGNFGDLYNDCLDENGQRKVRDIFGDEFQKDTGIRLTDTRVLLEVGKLRNIEGHTGVENGMIYICKGWKWELDRFVEHERAALSEHREKALEIYNEEGHSYETWKDIPESERADAANAFRKWRKEKTEEYNRFAGEVHENAPLVRVADERASAQKTLPELFDYRRIRGNAELQIKLLVQAMIEWAEKNKTRGKDDDRPCVLALDLELTEGQIKGLYDKLYEALGQLPHNNEELEVFLDNLSIVSGKGPSLAERLHNISTLGQGRVSPENIIVITPSPNMEHFDGIKDGNKKATVVGIHARGAPETEYGFPVNETYLPLPDIMLLAIARHLGKKREHLLCLLVRTPGALRADQLERFREGTLDPEEIYREHKGIFSNDPGSFIIELIPDAIKVDPGERTELIERTNYLLAQA